MSEQLWYYIDAAQAQQGPITIPQLQALVASGHVTPATVVWTEALGEQWIPASNVEGLFPESIPVQAASVAVQAPPEMPDANAMPSEIAQVAAPAPTLASSAAAPALRAADTVTQQPQQPQAAPTTPMLASTPTTQAIAGTVAPIPAVNEVVAQVAQAVPAAVEDVVPVAQEQIEPLITAADANAVISDAPKKDKNVLGIILLVLGLGVAGGGGYLFSTDGGTGLSYGLLGGGGVVAILGLIMTLKGKKISETIVTSAAGGYSALGAVAGGNAATPAGTFDLSAAANVAPIAAGSTPVAIHANPLMPVASSDTAAKPSPFAGAPAATKPNPLLPNGTVVAPQNRLNTSVPAKPATPPADANQS